MACQSTPDTITIQISLGPSISLKLIYLALRKSTSTCNSWNPPNHGVDGSKEQSCLTLPPITHTQLARTADYLAVLQCFYLTTPQHASQTMEMTPHALAGGHGCLLLVDTACVPKYLLDTDQSVILAIDLAQSTLNMRSSSIHTRQPTRTSSSIFTGFGHSRTAVDQQWRSNHPWFGC
jgi:hypothetical protein